MCWGTGGSNPVPSSGESVANSVFASSAQNGGGPTTSQIDTAEIYGDGRSEKLIGRVISAQRDRVFLVSKVWPNHVMGPEHAWT